MGCGWQSPFEMRRETIGWNDVKPGARQQHDACFLRLTIHRSQCFKARDLATDIHVMSFRPQTGFRHLAESTHERTCAVQNCFYFATHIQFFGLTQREGTTVEITDFCLGTQQFFIPSGKNGTQSVFQRLIDDELTGIAVGTVNEEIAHVIFMSHLHLHLTPMQV